MTFVITSSAGCYARKIVENRILRDFLLLLYSPIVLEWIAPVNYNHPKYSTKPLCCQLQYFVTIQLVFIKTCTCTIFLNISMLYMLCMYKCVRFVVYRFHPFHFHNLFVRTTLCVFCNNWDHSVERRLIVFVLL